MLFFIKYVNIRYSLNIAESAEFTFCILCEKSLSNLSCGHLNIHTLLPSHPYADTFTSIR